MREPPLADGLCPVSIMCALICWKFLQGHSRDSRLPNRRAVNEKIEPRFLSWPITSGWPFLTVQTVQMRYCDTRRVSC
jgi:hypothetical protein